MGVIALVIAASVAFGGDVTRTLTYSPEDIKLGTDNGYTTVSFAGYPHLDRVGAPDLPQMGYSVVIPPTAEVTGLEIVDLAEEPVAGSHYLSPVQYPAPYMDNPPAMPVVQPDPRIYSLDSRFPAEPVEFVTAGTKGGYRLASFRVFPVRYNPVARQLSVVTRLVVRVNYETGRIPVARRTETQNAMHGDALRRIVLNSSDVDRFAPPERRGSAGSAFLPAGTYEHVILTPQAFRDSFIALRDWRTRQGWRSKIMPIESIVSLYSGRDTAEKMRNFLKDAETTWGTLFCFIARNDWPAHQYRAAYVNVSGYPVDYLPADMYYSCLDGSWDADGDGVYGEPNDSCDAWADVHVGMVTINTGSELNKLLAKTFRYEFSPDTGWFCKSLLGNDVSFSNEYNDSIANASPSPPWFDLKMYYSGGMVTPTVQRYCDSLNSGYPITAVIAHGSNDIYGMGGDVTSTHMINLTNANRLSMFTGVCCHTGEWDAVGNTNGDCIAENMAFHAPNGFVGVMMNTRYGWVAVAEYFNYSICYGLLGHRTPRRITQGEALSFGKDYWHALVAVTTDTSKFRWEAYERTLFGEPAVPIWTGRAFNVAVTKPGAINIGSGVPVNVTVSTLTDAPVESAMVCLVKGEETFARGFTDAAGSVTLTVSPLTPGHLQLTVTGANNIPYLDSIVVMASGKYVSYLRHSISDPAPGGNDDGIINPGESFTVPMWVKNYGTQTAATVTGRLITHTAGATITDSIKSFGSIAGGDSALNSAGFGMTVTGGLPNGYSIPCSLVCRDATDSTWVSFVTFRVGAPLLNYIDKSVRDSLGSSPNGKLDPGETADLTVTVGNAGLGHATNVRAVLRSGDPRLTVPDSAAVYGVVPAGGTATNDADHFAIHADASIPMETPVVCTLVVYADAGYARTTTFSIVVGEIRTVDPIPDGPRQPALYWAYDEVDSTYSECPDYSWVELRGIGTPVSLTDDQTVVVTLPSSFGPVRYYGQNYSQLSICGNGWVGLGSTSSSAYSNAALPASSMPPMICANWDDLYPPTGGGVRYWHDTLNRRFIVEWDSVAYYSQRSSFESFEIIFHDTTSTSSGNSEVVVQYRTATQTSSSTVGIQNPTAAIAIQCLYDGSYTRGASPWIAGHAIKFTPEAPLVGLAGETGGALLPLRGIRVSPNPFGSRATVCWQLPHDGPADLRVFDAAGRVVRTLATGHARAGTHTSLWDGTDDLGKQVARGVYVVRLTAGNGTVSTKTVLTR
jgi:hypothetical protein